jgi:hypothetical protein
MTVTIPVKVLNELGCCELVSLFHKRRGRFSPPDSVMFFFEHEAAMKLHQ